MTVADVLRHDAGMASFSETIPKEVKHTSNPHHIAIFQEIFQEIAGGLQAVLDQANPNGEMARCDFRFSIDFRPIGLILVYFGLSLDCRITLVCFDLQDHRGPAPLELLRRLGCANCNENDDCLWNFRLKMQRYWRLAPENDDLILNNGPDYFPIRCITAFRVATSSTRS